MWQDISWLRSRRSMEIGVIVYCWIVIIARHRVGSESCVDKEGDACKTIDCLQPGVVHLCAKTCDICTEKGCKGGDYKTVEGRCESCDEPPPLTSQDTDSYNSSCGCPDGKWGRDCNETCGIGCTSTCRRWTGACHSGCKHCYWGSRCTRIYDNCICAKSRVCKCKKGYLGRTCDVPCPETCLNAECNNTRVCTRGCTEGWHGLQCGSPCGRNCENATCRRNTGSCDKGCTSGWYGDKCDMRCSGNCESGMCIRDTGSCDKGCTSGWYGDRCDMRCPGHCASVSCNRTDEACSPCKNGFSGFNCSTPCPPNCATNSCAQSSGSCNKCTTRYSGSHCNTSCPGNCATESCEQHGALCTGCKPGYSGPRCDTRCLDTCLNGTCDITDGSCLLGCKVGTYGHHCHRSCNVNCLKTNCSRDSGNCTHGCKDGWWGSQCDSRCPTHCARCDRVDAGCLGCEENYYGDNCSSRCSPRCGRCDSTGYCLTCAEGWEGDGCHVSTWIQMLWIVIPCLLIGILFILAFFVLRRNMNGPGKLRGQCFRYSSKRSTVLTIDNPTFENSPKGCHKPVVAVTNEVQSLMGDMEGHSVSTGTRVKDRQGTKVSRSRSPTSSNSSKPGVSQPRTHCPADSSYPECIWKTEVPVQNLSSFVAKMKIDAGLTKQFFDLPFGKLGSCDEAEMPGNAFKNRYRNILPYDHSRVKLESIPYIPGSDYINANYIHGYGRPRASVATQGPYGEVMWDFWRMIWEIETSKIVMLTNFVENGKAKCEQYWPDFGQRGSDYDDVHVQCVAEEELMDYTVRTFSVHRDEDPVRTVKQYHFTAWPDKGVPEDVGTLVDFHRLVKNAPSKSKGPVVVHCSAGIGRTGTWIALDYLIAQAKAEGVVDIFECIVRLRHQRMDLIQTEAQYLFLHDALTEALASCDKKTLECQDADKGASDVYAVVQKRKRNVILEQENDKYRRRTQLPLPEIPSHAADRFQHPPQDRCS
ncbi:multiple epidermal growth factor-like domains protein 10 isoform X2 [Haliotis rubra]|uniref:multiple epidermal growth factor-like domains protein 10 isoform X2 n=1 Tax=Haliotis rubra TaxID=36100 RepID=UPI001EE5D025|nr:multiple epidermal growth factor-like domains protein 10 isoform X2 [Haliotis rubra]